MWIKCPQVVSSVYWRFGYRRSIFCHFSFSVAPHFLKHNHLCICAIFSIFAHKQAMLITSDAKAAPIALLHLCAPIGGIVVEKSDTVAVDVILHINKRALQHEEIVYLRHTMN